MRGLFTLTFEIDGKTEDEIRAAGLALRRKIEKASAQAEPNFRKGLFFCTVDGRPEPRPPEPDNDSPERLFDG